MLEGKINLRRIDKVFNRVKRLKVRNGDVLVLYVDPSSFPPEKFHAKIQATLDNLTEKLTGMGKSGVTLLVLGPDQDADVISEAEMNVNGWYRKEA